jgi:hypothetical protein
MSITKRHANGAAGPTGARRVGEANRGAAEIAAAHKAMMLARAHNLGHKVNELRLRGETWVRIVAVLINLIATGDYPPEM